MKYIIAVVFSAAVTLALMMGRTPATQLNNSVNSHKRQAVQAEPPRKEITLVSEQEKAPTEQPVVPKPEVPVTPKGLAQAKAAQRGWTDSEWAALEDLWHKESGWNPTARNPDSGACGLPQAYPCSKIPNPDSVESQIDWGLDYIADRYTSPTKALAFWKYEAPKHNGSNWY